MNEQIKKLMQAADRQCSETRGVYDEILAELIVQECIKLAVFKGDAITGKAIKEHFGVEV